MRTFREGEFLLKQWEPGDETAILASFNRVFASVDPGFEPRTLEAWRWQYLANPSGKLLLSAVAPDGNVAAHHGFIVQRLWLDGQPALCGQVVDSMVDPSYRRGLQRVSLSALLSNRFIVHTGGEGPGRHAFYWGAPVRVAMRVGETLGRYEVVRTQMKLVAPLASVRVRTSGTVAVEELARFPGDVEALSSAAGRRYGAIAVRDREQLDWRYVERPGYDYRMAAARRDGALAGYAVFRRGGFDGRPDEGLICDWLVAEGDREAGAALLGWLVEEGRRAGAERLTAVFPDTCDDWLRFQDDGFRVEPTGYPFVAWTCIRRFDVDWLRAHWYYTLGDTDLV